VFVEATGDTHWIMASMELMETEGDFQDLRRGQDQTFLGLDQWTELLTQAGADATLCLPGNDHVLAPIGQQVFGARFKSDFTPLTIEELNEHLVTRLPEYMIPRHLQIVDSVPLSQNGKVDNAALSAWLPQHSGEQVLVGGEPRDELERRLAEIWGEMLGVARVGRDHDFFELGGDSLLVSQVTAHILETVPEASGLYFDHLMLRMLDEPRVSALAVFLREGPELAKEHHRDSADSQLVRLDGADGDGRPLEGGCVSVLVHDELGTVAHYRELARELARQGPVLGVTVTDTSAYLALDTTALVQQIASRYSQLICESVGGPLRIIGHGAGAMLAAEVARATIEQGAEVAELVLVDPQHIECLLEDDLAVELAFAHTVGIDPESLGFPAGGLLAQAFQATNGNVPRRVAAGTIAAFADATSEVGLQRLARRPPHERLAAILLATSALRPDLEATGDLAGCFDRFRHSLTAFTQHDAQLYAGNIAVLRPSHARQLPWQAQDPTGYWRGVCIGELRIVEIPGDHLGSLHAPQVERTAQLVHGGQSTAAQVR
jgi:pyochelin synthetase